MPSNRISQAQVRRQRLLSMLADGSFHSGEHLAKRLRISRGGIWKLVRSLRALGIEVQSVPRQGYRLARAVDLFDKGALLQSLSPAARALLDRADILLTVDSTNRYVADNPTVTAGHAQVCIAELQNAGRGRRGRSWVAPFGAGICLSIGWQFLESPPTFSALSLAVGVAAVNALHRFGAQEVGLKWPNDLTWRNRKLGGILIEMRGESAGPSHVVIGIGLNMQMPAAVRLALAEQQAALIADVHEMLRDRTPSRNALAGALVEEVMTMLQTFTEQGFAPFIDEWTRLDTLANAPVKVISGTGTILGTARGVEVDGALLVDVNGQLRRFVSGEVSLRAATHSP
jgi:BirA family biotin operon repressor/biotin-[acetyl-CoA-carboxylase] ligase